MYCTVLGKIPAFKNKFELRFLRKVHVGRGKSERERDGEREREIERESLWVGYVNVSVRGGKNHPLKEPYQMKFPHPRLPIQD